MRRVWCWARVAPVLLTMLLVAALAAAGPANAADHGWGSIEELARERGLTPDDVVAALKTYLPSGVHDEYLMFASGGHSGQALVIGLPSMRLLRSIAVFTPEPWQGWGFGVQATEEVLSQGHAGDQALSWGDTHHPALSETRGEYDGQWLFLNDKANGRVAVIDLRDFETKQIVKNPLALNDHGATFVTPNTEYVIEGPQYSTPLGWEYAPIEEYADRYRGIVTLWKFDRLSGRIDPEQSFAMELPPYWQDLADAGKGPSDGWFFLNSINTELSTGGIESGQPPFEAGVSMREMDYLHVIDWRRAEEVVREGKAQTVRGMRVIPLQTAIDEELLFFVPEPKSPHGIDVAPGGDYLVVSGKLDPHVTVYSFEKMLAAFRSGRTTPDPYGVPVVAFDDVVVAQVEVGLGPLHTQFDDQGYAYTSLFLDSTVARWSLGPPYREDGWKLVETIPVHYNVGHVAVAGGDTAHPDGRYLVSLNKWSIDRFASVGPLLPQNLQLIDISGDRMQRLYDMPLGVGEPHYAQIIRADKLQPWDVYPRIGWDPHTQRVDPEAAMPGNERVERRGNTVEIWMTAVRSHFNPERIEIQKGDHVIWHITNMEQARDATHGFALPGYNITASIEPGEAVTFEFDATHDGVFTYYCTEFCSALHLEMTGYLLIRP